VAEPFPEAHSRDREGREWALARASDVATGRQSWKDDPGLGDVVTKHYAGDDRDVEVVMAACCRRLEGAHG
jgi:hypothetical protein